MANDFPFDDTLAARLPLPLAQLLRRAANAKTARDRHDAAYYLWEAGLKLLGANAVVAYAALPEHDPALTERLQNLARPAVGHWWEFVRALVPRLAEAGVAGFAPVRELLLGMVRDDLPRAAGLNAALQEALQGKTSARSTVQLAELFDRLVSYRNKEIGHGAVGQKPTAHYDKLGRALLLGLTELFAKLDVLAGQRLLYIAEVRRRGDGAWIVERADLSHERYQRVESLVVAAAQAETLPHPERLYLETPTAGKPDGPLRLLHPLLLYDAEADEVQYLNARRGKARVEYLAYNSGRVLERAELAGEQRALLRRVLDAPDEQVQVEAWQALSAAEEPADAAMESAPRQLGEFELLTKLGQGGMGVVYRARQPSLGRQVALKCLFRTGDPKAEARFAREISALGRVDHPHLVKIFSSGSEGENWFYAMELIEGATLATVCERLQSATTSAGDLDLPTWRETVSSACADSRQQEQPISDDRSAGGSPAEGKAGEPPAQRHNTPAARSSAGSYVRQMATLVRQVCAATQALHDEKIIHRDIKPGNIMVTPDGATAVLMDLGLAQVADEVEGRLTRTRQFVGTLRYASPEQVLAVGRLDARSDVYSLGATLWELLALRPLFNADEQTPTPELMQRIQYEEPVRLRKLNPAVPRDLAAIVEKCLQKEARKRYATAHELSEDLERFLEGRPVRARAATGVERAVKWARRRPALAALIGVIVLATVGLLGGGIWFTLQLDDAREKAETHAENEEQKRKEAEDATKEAKKQQGIADKERTEAVKARGESDKQKTLAEGRAKELQDLLGKLQKSETTTKEQLLQLATLSGLAADDAWETGKVERAHELLASVPADLRQWEWRFRKRRLEGSYATLFGHTREVNWVAFSPDGQRLASASDDQTVKLWDAGSGQELLTLRGHADSVRGVAFSPDGQRLASASDDQTVKLWDAQSGQHLLTLRGHAHGVLSVAFSPDGQRLASASEEINKLGEVKLWDAKSGQHLLTLRGHTSFVRSVAFSPDGQRLASASGDKTVKLWDAKSGQHLLTLRGHAHGVLSVAFSPDGQRLASASEDDTVKLWDARGGQELLTLRGHSGVGMDSVAFSPNGQLLASASDQRVKLWDARSGQELLTLRGHTDRVWSLAFSPDGQRLASASVDKTVKLWDAKTGQEQRTLFAHTAQVMSVAFSPDGQRLASASVDQTVKLWDARSGQELLTLRGHTKNVRSVAFSPDGQRLASASVDQTVKLWDARSGQELLTLRGHTKDIMSVAFSSDGQRLASASLDETVKLWDAKSGLDLLTLRGHKGWVTSVAFSPDGQRLASASLDETVKLWDARSGQELRTLRGDTLGVLSVAFSPDGQRLASATMFSVLTLWDAKSGLDLLTLRGHKGWVTSVAFSSDGQRLASASIDQTVKLWDARSGQELLTLTGHKGWVTSVAFSPDSLRLASASDDHTLKLWHARRSQELLTLRGHKNYVRSVAFSPDGQRLASASVDKTVKLWDARSGQELLTLRGHTDWVLSVAFSPDGQRLASASVDKTVKLWDARSGQELLTLRGHTNVVGSVAFSPDGQRLASASEDKTVKLWDTRSGQELLTLREHKDMVLSVAFSPDAKRLFGKDIRGVQLTWDLKTGNPVPDAPKAPAFRDDRATCHPTLPIMALVQDNYIRVIDMKPLNEAEIGFRQGMGRFDVFWHKELARRSEVATNWFAAAFHWSQLAEHEPGQAENWKGLAAACSKLGDWRLARAACDRAAARDPNLAAVYFQRAKFRAPYGQFYEAIVDNLVGLALTSRAAKK